jgi:hypothetical protein
MIFCKRRFEKSYVFGMKESNAKVQDVLAYFTEVCLSLCYYSNGFYTLGKQWHETEHGNCEVSKERKMTLWDVQNLKLSRANVWLKASHALSRISLRRTCHSKWSVLLWKLKILFLRVYIYIYIYCFYFFWNKNVYKVGRNLVPISFVWKKTEGKRVHWNCWLKPEDNIKMDLIVVNLERGFVWLRAQSSGVRYETCN